MIEADGHRAKVDWEARFPGQTLVNPIMIPAVSNKTRMFPYLFFGE